MPGWIYPLAYLIGYTLCWRVLYSNFMATEIEMMKQRNAEFKRSNRQTNIWANRHKLATKVSDDDRGKVVLGSALVSIGWPLLVVAGPMYMFATRTTKAEKELVDQQELDRLRKQAKDLGLPFPDEIEPDS